MNGPTMNNAPVSPEFFDALDSPPELAWSDALLLGYAPMDRTHEAFVQSVTALRAAPDAELVARLADLRQHLETHFGQEDLWMVETQFPARDCHIDEHAAVLNSVREVQAVLEDGDVDNCRRLADELARWFPGHTDYLDSALAHWMCKQRLGGKPVVIRRGIASGDQD